MRHEVQRLVSYAQEGDYWDFKSEWYALGSSSQALRDKAREDLVLDVLCMSNSPAFRDALIIIGVDNATHRVAGVEDDANRRDSEQVIDLLRGRRYCGGCFPHARVETISLEDHSVDVIVVEATREVPYMLSEDFGRIRAGVVYSRDGGTNTPINKGANQQTLDLLWRRRFGLDMSPKERLLCALRERSAWREIPGAGHKDLYLEDAPEYTITFDREEYEEREENGYEFYFFTQTDCTPRYEYCSCKYHGTVLAKTVCVMLDGGRLVVPAPTWASVNPDIDLRMDGHMATHYGCYEEDSEDWLLYQLLYDPDVFSHRIANDNLMYNIPVYRSKAERREFERYVRENAVLEEEVSSIDGSVVPGGKVDDFAREVYKRQLDVSRAMKLLLGRWRRESGCGETLGT